MRDFTTIARNLPRTVLGLDRVNRSPDPKQIQLAVADFFHPELRAREWYDNPFPENTFLAQWHDRGVDQIRREVERHQRILLGLDRPVSFGTYREVMDVIYQEGVSLQPSEVFSKEQEGYRVPIEWWDELVQYHAGVECDLPWAED